MSRIRERADPRPRIYITGSGEKTRWSLAPNAQPRAADTPGAALDAALAAIGGGEAVVIVGGWNG